MQEIEESLERGARAVALEALNSFVRLNLYQLATKDGLQESGVASLGLNRGIELEIPVVHFCSPRFKDARNIGVVLDGMLFERQQLGNIQHVVDTMLNGWIPTHLGDRHGSEEVQDIPSGEVAVIAIIQQKAVGKRLAEVVYADAINDGAFGGIFLGAANSMRLDELNLRHTVLFGFQDKHLPVYFQSHTGKVLTGNKVESPGNFGVSRPAVEVVESLLVPCGILAGGLGHDAVSDGVHGHAAHNLLQEAGVFHQIAAPAYQLRADSGSQVERGVARATSGDFRTPG